MRGGVGLGKRGVLRLLFERDDRGRSILRDLYRETPIIVQRALYFDEQMPGLPCVYVLSSGGPVVEGDSYLHTITLKEGACAHISTGAATKVAQMSGGCASLNQMIELRTDAYLEYLPEPTIPCAGSRYRVDSRLVVASSATLFYSDIYLCGRRYSGEQFLYQQLDVATRLEREDGTLLFCDRQVAEPALAGFGGAGVMAGWEVFATVLIAAPSDVVNDLYSAIEPRMGQRVALGVHLLPFDAGVVCRIMGHESQEVKGVVRELCSMLRQRVHGVALPDEFVWR